MPANGYTPALGFAGLTPFYDLALRLATRERIWRSKLLNQVAPANGEAILDVGCGTGTFAIALKRRAPEARVVGIDPDPAILDRAAAKATAAGVQVEWRHGYARDVADYAGEFDKAVCSLVFHQVPLPEKTSGIAAMMTAVRPGGDLHIADYAFQDSWMMRQLFRTVQLFDGRENTQANADGALERILSELEGASSLPATGVVKTPTGAISLFHVRKSASGHGRGPGHEHIQTTGQRSPSG